MVDVANFTVKNGIAILIISVNFRLPMKKPPCGAAHDGLLAANELFLSRGYKLGLPVPCTLVRNVENPQVLDTLPLHWQTLITHLFLLTDNRNLLSDAYSKCMHV